MNTPNARQLQLFSTPEPSLKSSFCDWEIDQQGLKKEKTISGYEQTEKEALKIKKDKGYESCSDTSICSQDVEDSPKQPSNLGEYKQPSLLKSTPMLKQSCDRTSQEYQFTQILETTSQITESLTSLPVDSPALARVTQELKQDLITLLQPCGLKVYELSRRRNPNSWWLNNQQEFRNEDYELFLEDSEWQDIKAKLKLSRRRSLEQDTKDSDCSLFPTLTSGQTSTKMRPAGQVKCEKWFKDNGLIPSGYQLGTKAIALTMGFPSSWFEVLTEQYSKNQTTPSQVKPQAESEQGIWQDEQLHQPKQPSPSDESFISTQLLGGKDNSLLQKDKSLSPKLFIPCLVKQPKQPEVKGLIREDKGDRFTVYIPDSDSTITYLKLFVYPDFSKSDEQIEKNPRKNITPSTNNPRKTRRKKGQGNGTIYYRTVTKNGKEYQEAYYHYVENGNKKTKYIPKKLLHRVQEAESQKLPVGEILILLGGDKNNPRKSSSTLSVEVEQKINDGCIEQVLETNDLNPRKITPPSKRRRNQGEGSGWIECKPIKRSGKEYKQYWYHYEEWREGDRKSKKSKYIPKRVRSRIERMNQEKAPVNEILKVLKDKRKK